MQESMHMLLYRAFHAQRNILRPYMRTLGLGTGQPKLVAYLAAHGPCRQGELVDYFAIDPAAISRMVDSLEKGGFITVAPDKSNRRRKLLSITDKHISIRICIMRKLIVIQEIANHFFPIQWITINDIRIYNNCIFFDIWQSFFMDK